MFIFCGWVYSFPHMRLLYVVFGLLYYFLFYFLGLKDYFIIKYEYLGRSVSIQSAMTFPLGAY